MSSTWSYEGECGPAHWGDLQPEFTACKEGKQQSPVDIGETSREKLEPVRFHYQADPLRIINNGHSIQVNCEPGSTATIDGKAYQLLQYHFHAPSEHTVAGSAYDMEAHLVHRGEEGELAVIGVFMKQGESNDLIRTLWDNLPAGTGNERAANSIRVQAENLLPDARDFYRYSGSLTTPPCTEKVLWIMMKEAIGVSGEQMSAFTALYPNNAWPVQPLHGRVVLESS